MEVEIYWLRFAESKLDEIYRYYHEVAGQKVAEKLVMGIIESTISLEVFPEAGQREPLLMNRKEEFRYLVHKNYKIIYWINTEKSRVEIVNVFDVRQNPQKMNFSE